MQIVRRSLAVASGAVLISLGSAAMAQMSNTPNEDYDFAMRS